MERPTLTVEQWYGLRRKVPREEQCPTGAHTVKRFGQWQRHPSADEIPVALRLANGTWQMKLACRTCRHTTGFLPHTIINEWGLRSALAIVKDGPDCCYEGCTNVGGEYHHWAPRSVFGWEESGRYGVVVLCREHHRQWHTMMDGYRWQARGVA